MAALSRLLLAVLHLITAFLLSVIPRVPTKATIGSFKTRGVQTGAFKATLTLEWRHTPVSAVSTSPSSIPSLNYLHENHFEVKFIIVNHLRSAFHDRVTQGSSMIFKS